MRLLWERFLTSPVVLVERPVTAELRAILATQELTDRVGRLETVGRLEMPATPATLAIEPELAAAVVVAAERFLMVSQRGLRVTPDQPELEAETQRPMETAVAVVRLKPSSEWAEVRETLARSDRLERPAMLALERGPAIRGARAMLALTATQEPAEELAGRGAQQARRITTITTTRFRGTRRMR